MDFKFPALSFYFDLESFFLKKSLFEFICLLVVFHDLDVKLNYLFIF